MNYGKETSGYWGQASNRFSNNIRKNLQRDDRNIWRDLIIENAPQGETIKILDIGTGPGFFAIILSQAGYDVTGIDITEEMIRKAEENAEREGVHPRFMVMDSHHLDFPDETFDLIINRNVTWTLYEPETAYRDWKRVLKPNGKLIVFDGEWYMNFFDDEKYAEMKSGLREYRRKYGPLPETFAMNKIEDYWTKLPLIGVKRPEWDKAVLRKIGFKQIETIEDISDTVSKIEADRLLYGIAPMFMIIAVKATQAEEKQKLIETYWNGYAPENGQSCIEDWESFKKDAYAHYIGDLIPSERPLRILDVGCGAGFLSCVLAEGTHEVKGLDISENMLEEAKFCAEQLGVDVEFYRGDVENPPFEGESFDMIIGRSITWLLQAPKETFLKWHNLLKPSGRLIYFDTNRYPYLPDPDLESAFKENRRKMLERSSKIIYGAGLPKTQIMDVLAEKLPMTNQKRPGYDLALLEQTEFKLVKIDENINNTIMDDKECEENELTPLFAVCAEKI